MNGAAFRVDFKKLLSALRVPQTNVNRFDDLMLSDAAGFAQFHLDCIGTAVGFLLAAIIAIKTISSPIGPIASTLLIGLGATIGSLARGSSAREAGE